MHFKSAVLLCALYFVAKTQSIGFDQREIEELNALFIQHKDPITGILPNDVINSYLKNVGYTGGVEQFKEGFVLNNETMPDFLIMLADHIKIPDSLMQVCLTTYEVRLFVGWFKVQNERGKKNGHLTGAEIYDILNDQPKIIKNYNNTIKTEFKDENAINVLQYLTAIMKHKKENFRQHLNKKQIDKCRALYDSSKDHLDSVKQKALFKSLNLVSEEYDYLLDFDHVRPAAHELQELLVFYSEYDEDFDSEAPFTTNVGQFMWEFAKLYDKNHDGLLNIQEELLKFAKTYTTESFYGKIEAFLEEFHPDRSRPMCPAMFMEMQITLQPDYNSMDISRIVNDMWSKKRNT
ncbi:uncharacterized protein LOC126844835 [Adelges cooleyi]|uniref:uncharacterized protein LOC126844835 n=1 Tax=Adelges cooleyi TaxID=133065 RepID=UPI00217FEEF4|nr:uncharacterized protein LOC126844835 [Adelges cooleyi]